MESYKKIEQVIKEMDEFLEQGVDPDLDMIEDWRKRLGDAIEEQG